MRLLLGRQKTPCLLQRCGLSLVSSAPKKWRLTRWPIDPLTRWPLKGNSEVHLHTPTKFGEDPSKDLGGVGEQTNSGEDPSKDLGGVGEQTNRQTNAARFIVWWCWQNRGSMGWKAFRNASMHMSNSGDWSSHFYFHLVHYHIHMATEIYALKLTTVVLVLREADEQWSVIFPVEHLPHLYLLSCRYLTSTPVMMVWRVRISSHLDLIGNLEGIRISRIICLLLWDRG